ncbi:MAG: hypothetical protein M3433_07430 [Actinomycetota bacterium]|nr:hypothetical protein [Actinomycetota bacterium]MDQ3648399.1 hypothetical protein [Actinomycetota bacterium]
MSQSVDASILTARERDALCGAATWYAKYHASVVSEAAGQRNAAAVSYREEYLDLIAALRKLGVGLRVPDGLLAAHLGQESATAD